LAPAQVSKCQGTLQKEVGKLEKDLYLRLNKCADKVRKEREKGLIGLTPKGSLAKAAAFCEKMLSKTVDVARVSGGKSKIDKFFSGVDKAGTTGKCDASGLDDLGHFVSGVNAPPDAASDFLEFTKNFLAAQALYTAWSKQVLANDETRTRIQDAIDAPPDTKGNAATDCALGTINRPNLCAFHKDTASSANGLDSVAGTLNPLCRTHACRLVPGDGLIATSNDSDATLNMKASSLVEGMNGTLIMNVCDLGNLAAPFTLQEYFLLSGTASNSVMKVPLASIGHVCLRTYRVEGWCDCKPGGGSGLPVLNSSACQDHVVDPNDVDSLLGTDSCPGGRPQEGTEEECVCAPPTETNCGGLDPCDPRTPFERCEKDSDCATAGDVCVAREGRGRCHAGTWNGEQVIELADPTGEGDCLVFTTNNLTLVPDEPFDLGPDGKACTDDDNVAQGADGLVPLTTGQADAVVLDAITLSWTAQCDAGRVGDDCMEDSNCDVTGGDGHCDTTGSALGTISVFAPVSGQALGSCADLETSDLAGLRLAGAFPILDAPNLGDLAFTYRFVCE
jgi:hypothetical protein